MSARIPAGSPQLPPSPKPPFWKDTYRTHPLPPLGLPPPVIRKVTNNFLDVRAKVVSWR